jgi:hypothetical protein
LKAKNLIGCGVGQQVSEIEEDPIKSSQNISAKDRPLKN